MCTNYVTENLLHCIKKNGIYPQDVQHSETIMLHFGAIGLSVIKTPTRGSIKFKHINYWSARSAEEINNLLGEQEWREEQ